MYSPFSLSLSFSFIPNPFFLPFPSPSLSPLLIPSPPPPPPSPLLTCFFLYIYRHKLVHRDIHSKNILIKYRKVDIELKDDEKTIENKIKSASDLECTAKLVDFGQSHYLDSNNKLISFLPQALAIQSHLSKHFKPHSETSLAANKFYFDYFCFALCALELYFREHFTNPKQFSPNFPAYFHPSLLEKSLFLSLLHKILNPSKTNYDVEGTTILMELKKCLLVETAVLCLSDIYQTHSDSVLPDDGDPYPP